MDTGPSSLQNGAKLQNGARLQTLIDQSKGKCTLPEGTFRLTEPLKVQLDKTGRLALDAKGTTVVMEGPGPALRIIGSFVKGNADPRNVPKQVRDREQSPSVQGLRIQGVHPLADGIEVEGTMELSIKGVGITGCRHGIHLIKLNRNLLVDTCQIYDNTGIGIFYDQVNLHQSNISGCHISYCHQGGIVSRGGDVRNIQVGTCDIEANMQPGNPRTDPKDPDPRGTANIELDSTGGSVAEVAITGCTIQHSRAPNSANIRILGKGSDGKGGTTREGHITITGNVLSDVAVNLDLNDCRGVTVTGNTFWMGYDHNLRATRSSQVVVGPNIMERNPRYDYGTSKETSNSVLFKSCSDCTIQGLHIHQANRARAGLVFEDCSGLLVSGCNIIDCEPLGILFLRVQESLVTGCRVKGRRGANSEVKAQGCRDLELTGNNFNLSVGNP